MSKCRNRLFLESILLTGIERGLIFELFVRGSVDEGMSHSSISR